MFEESLPQLLIDADALIKLNKAGILLKVVESFECVVPTAVYDEAVVVGRAFLHEDAEDIEHILEGTVTIVEPIGSTGLGVSLGRGETAVSQSKSQYPDALVVTDDRRFTSALRLTTDLVVSAAELLTLLARSRVLSLQEALEALERLRPSIRETIYKDIQSQLLEGDDLG